MMTNNSKWKCRNFLESETHCFCGCGFQITTDCQTAVQGVRDIMQRKKDAGMIDDARMFINSGARCDIYNKTIPKSANNSYHKLGMALDVRVLNEQYGYDLLESILEYNSKQVGYLKPNLNGKDIYIVPPRFNYIRIYNTFVHIDLRPYEQRKVRWVA